MGQQYSRFRDLARQLLEHGQGGTAVDLVASMEGAFRRLHEHTRNLVGQVGFEALLARAAHLTKAEASWIASITIHVEPFVTLTGLAERFESEGVAQTMDGLTILLANLIGLLCTFIGEPLTLLLIRRIWPEVAVKIWFEGGQVT